MYIEIPGRDSFIHRNSMSFISLDVITSDVNSDSTASKTPPSELRISGFNQVSVKTITWEDKEKLSVYNLVNLLCKPLVF